MALAMALGLGLPSPRASLIKTARPIGVPPSTYTWSIPTVERQMLEIELDLNGCPDLEVLMAGGHTEQGHARLGG